MRHKHKFATKTHGNGYKVAVCVECGKMRPLTSPKRRMRRKAGK